MNDGKTEVLHGFGNHRRNFLDPQTGRTGYKGDIVGEKNGKRIQGILGRAVRRGLGSAAPRRGRGRLALGQTVGIVVQDQEGQIHIFASRMGQMSSADAQAVSVTSYNEHRQIGAGRLHSRSNRQGSSVGPVQGIGVEVVGKAPGTPDPGDNDRLFRRNLQVAESFFNPPEHTVVAAAGAPNRADLFPSIVWQCCTHR